MAGKLKVLITGASGYVASQMLPEYRDRYDLVLVDVKNTDRDGQVVPGVVIADLADPDRSRYEHLFDGVDSVIHLGYMRSSPGGVFGSETPQIDRFDLELANVRMANNVYRVAYDAGVRRVVSASSNHAADWYEDYQIHVNRKDMVRPDEPPVSSNFYGWAKASYELLGWPYACGTFGRRLEFVMVRIGHPTPVNAARHMAEDPGLPPAGSGIANFKRNLACYFSPRRPAATFPQSRGGGRRFGQWGSAVCHRLRNQQQHSCILVARLGAPGDRLRAGGRFGSGLRRGCPALSDRRRHAWRPRWGISNYLKRPVIPVKRDLCITNSPHSDPSRHVTLSEAEGSGSEGWGVVVRRAGDSSLRSE